MRGAVLFAASYRHLQRQAERAAHLGTLLARDGEQFGRVVRRQRAGEAGVDAALDMPARAFRQHAAAQLERWAGEPLGQRPTRLRERDGNGGIVRQHAAAHREGARDQRAAEQR